MFPDKMAESLYAAAKSSDRLFLEVKAFMDEQVKRLI
jgi:hypothetical protein